tara:strand:+ start:891 stop:1307 length:417 start_codon:yes stop_codon:yes gene_type:complete
MAYVSSTNTGGSQGNRVTFRGFSSKASEANYKLYDFECAKQDLLNRLTIRKGERVENPEFGTIIYDLLFEQFTDSLKEAVTDDITQNLNADPRIGVEEIRVTEAEHGIAIQASIRYVPLDITEKMQFIFTEDMANDLI